MADIEKVIKGLEKWIDDHLAQNVEIEPQLVHDALELLKEYKKHLQNDLKNLNKKKLQVENEINGIAQAERLCRYGADNNKLPNKYDCNPLGCDACSYYRIGT